MDVQENNRRDVASLMERILYEVKKVIVGQDRFLERVLIAVLAQGHLLVEGVPGLAKTLTVKTLARTIRGSFKRIQFTPDLVPADLVGTRIYNQKTGDFTTSLGPVFTNLLLADEINRAPAKTQAALLEAMAERQVTVDGVTHPLEAPFTVFATQNPVEHEGTYPLPEAQLDRFLLKTVMGYPSHEAELAMLASHEGGFDPEQVTVLVAPLIGEAEVRALRALVDRVRVAPEIQGYIAAITRGTRGDPSISLGASPRATVALMRAARAGAVLEGRDYVVPDDVKGRVRSVLRHRITLAPELEVEGRTVDEVVDMVVSRIKVPE
jgi:MoxR-like ATPase